MDKDEELNEAVGLIEILLDLSCLDDMIKDLKLSGSPKDKDFLDCCIALRGQAKGFMEKHAKKEGGTS